MEGSREQGRKGVTLRQEKQLGRRKHLGTDVDVGWWRGPNTFESACQVGAIVQTERAGGRGNGLQDQAGPAQGYFLTEQHRERGCPEVNEDGDWGVRGRWFHYLPELQRLPTEEGGVRGVEEYLPEHPEEVPQQTHRWDADQIQEHPPHDLPWGEHLQDEPEQDSWAVQPQQDSLLKGGTRERLIKIWCG